MKAADQTIVTPPFIYSNYKAEPRVTQVWQKHYLQQQVQSIRGLPRSFLCQIPLSRGMGWPREKVFKHFSQDWFWD